eukprot:TRINITY_DN0_c518_g1_i4.p1 TRINITY_DN0_c518_g1~~TRINITY_DN0_c518_g1_i4.p1  ORF type:complete len:163 (-),score=2.10 TRINITY_DN0_c518_g1_i4:145-633(-)
MIKHSGSNTLHGRPPRRHLRAMQGRRKTRIFEARVLADDVCEARLTKRAIRKVPRSLREPATPYNTSQYLVRHTSGDSFSGNSETASSHASYESMTDFLTKEMIVDWGRTCAPKAASEDGAERLCHPPTSETLSSLIEHLWRQLARRDAELATLRSGVTGQS